MIITMSNGEFETKVLIPRKLCPDLSHISTKQKPDILFGWPAADAIASSITSYSLIANRFLLAQLTVLGLVVQKAATCHHSGSPSYS